MFDSNNLQPIGRSVLTRPMLRGLAASLRFKAPPSGELLAIEKSDGLLILCDIKEKQRDRDARMVLHLQIGPLASSIGPHQLLKLHRVNCHGDYAGEWKACDFYRIGDTHISVTPRSPVVDTAETPQDNLRSRH